MVTRAGSARSRPSRHLAVVLKQESQLARSAAVERLGGQHGKDYPTAEDYLKQAHLLDPDRSISSAIWPWRWRRRRTMPNRRRRPPLPNSAHAGSAERQSGVTLGWILYRLGRVGEAEQSLNAALKARNLSRRQPLPGGPGLFRTRPQRAGGAAVGAGTQDAGTVRASARGTGTAGQVARNSGIADQVRGGAKRLAGALRAGRRIKKGHGKSIRRLAMTSILKRNTVVFRPPGMLVDCIGWRVRPPGVEFQRAVDGQPSQMTRPTGRRPLRYERLTRCPTVTDGCTAVLSEPAPRCGRSGHVEQSERASARVE